MKVLTAEPFLDENDILVNKGLVERQTKLPDFVLLVGYLLKNSQHLFSWDPGGLRDGITAHRTALRKLLQLFGQKYKAYNETVLIRFYVSLPHSRGLFA